MFLPLKREIRLLIGDFIGEALSELERWNELKEFKSQHSFSDLKGHLIMLSDDIRCESYKSAIKEVVKPGDTVLDLGTGLGIMAFFAVQARAKKVYAIDSSKIINVAKEVVKKNNFKNIIFIRSDIRDLDNIIPKVDCIISENIGIAVINEGLIWKLKIAKEKFLKEKGRMIPKKIDILLIPVESSQIGQGFWNRKLYGIDFSAVKENSNEVKYFFGNFKEDKTIKLADEKVMCSLDLMNLPKGQIKCEQEFEVKREGNFHGFLGYFKAFLSDNIILSTSPYDKPTHWNQFFLPAERVEKVKKGDLIKIKLWAIEKNTKWKWKCWI